MKPTGRRIEVYRDAAKQWRWRERAANGQVVITSHEGYCRRGRAIMAAHLYARPWPIWLADWRTGEWKHL